MMQLIRASVLRSATPLLAIMVGALTLGGCSSIPLGSGTKDKQGVESTAKSERKSRRDLPALPPAGSGRGGYYMDDGPADNPPAGLLDTPDAIPRVEPYARAANRPYKVFGKTYTPFTDNRPYKERGIGSWYGKKFHGQKTSSGEVYDMFKMTAAHPTLPIPSYVQVTNLSNGARVIVRVNDRGPFMGGRIIDLSYTAALKLGYLGKGSGMLEVVRLMPADIERITREMQQKTPARAPGKRLQNTDGSSGAAEVEALPVASLDDALTVLPIAASAAPPLPVSGSTEPRPAPGFYLQLGAFSQIENARALHDRLRPHLETGLPPVEIVESAALYRIYSGPFVSRDAAMLAAQQVQQAGGIAPIVLQR